MSYKYLQKVAGVNPNILRKMVFGLTRQAVEIRDNLEDIYPKVIQDYDGKSLKDLEKAEKLMGALLVLTNQLKKLDPTS